MVSGPAVAAVARTAIAALLSVLQAVDRGGELVVRSLDLILGRVVLGKDVLGGGDGIGERLHGLGGLPGRVEGLGLGNQVLQLVLRRLLHRRNLGLHQSVVRLLQSVELGVDLGLRRLGIGERLLGIAKGKLELGPRLHSVILGLEVLTVDLVHERLKLGGIGLRRLGSLGSVEAHLGEGGVLVGTVATGVDDLELHKATRRAKAHLLELIAVVEHAAVVVEFEGAHGRGRLEPLGGVGNIDARLKDVAVLAALTRQELHAGQVVRRAQIELEILRHTHAVDVVAVPLALVVVIQDVRGQTVLDRLGLALAGEAGHRDGVLVLLGVDELGLVDGEHLETLDGVADGNRRVGDLLLGVRTALEQVLSGLDRLGELGIGLLGVRRGVQGARVGQGGLER